MGKLVKDLGEIYVGNVSRAMGQKECKNFCDALPDVLNRPWWRPRIVKYLYCPTCRKSFPSLRIYYKLDSKKRKICICCGTNLRTVPRRAKKWRESAIYKALEEAPETSSGEKDEELLRGLVLAKYEEEYGHKCDGDHD